MSQEPRLQAGEGDGAEEEEEGDGAEEENGAEGAEEAEGDAAPPSFSSADHIFTSITQRKRTETFKIQFSPAVQRSTMMPCAEKSWGALPEPGRWAVRVAPGGKQ